MRRIVGAEVRRLVCWWPVWSLPAVVAAAGVAMLPVNADVYLSYVYDDPQGPEQELEAYRSDLAATVTSGLGWAQLAAFLLGAGLVVLGGARRPSRIVADAGVAALAGLVLAAVDLAAVLPRVPGALAGTIGAPATVALDGSQWPVAGCAVLQVALFGAAGAGLAAWTGRRWPVPAALGAATAGVALFLIRDVGAAYVAPLVAGFPVLVLWYLTVSGAPGTALLLTAAATALTLFIGVARAGAILTA